MRNDDGKDAIVVGGGIAGLATAVALRMVGWHVEVLEQAPEFGEVGAGISLWPNALRALDAIGLGDKVRANGTPETVAGLRDSSGQWLARSKGPSGYEPAILIHRAELIEILVGALPQSALSKATKVTRAHEGSDGAAVVEHEHGQLRGSLVVGADGIRSVVRASIFPDAHPPRYAGYTTWRFITAPISDRLEITESWGSGERFGGGQFRDGSVYCYAGASVPEGSRFEDEYAELKRRFGRWHDPIPRLLDNLDPKDLLRHDIYDLPALSSYVSKNVALVGDAAHAMTPDLGQGGCQALEDAVVLADALGRAASLEEGLALYGRRKTRTQSIVTQSRLLGWVGQWSSPPAVWLRDRLFSAVPSSAVLRILERPFDWDAPVLHAA